MFRLLLLSLSVGRQSVSVSATVTAVSEPSVSAVVSVTAITGLQLRHHFRLRPKPEKLVSVGLYTNHLMVPSVRRSTVGDRAFTVAGPRVWNTLPEKITTSQTLSTFRQQLQKIMSGYHHVNQHFYTLYN